MVQKRKQLKIFYIPLLEDIFWRYDNANVTIALPKYIKHKHTQIVTVVIDKCFELDILKHNQFDVVALESIVPIVCFIW